MSGFAATAVTSGVDIGDHLVIAILGNEDDNVLTAGSPVVMLTGGGGSDTFVFADSYTGAVPGKRDTITDFTQGTDKIDLTGIDSHFGTGIHSFDFIGDAAFSGHVGELHTSYDAAHNITVLEADTTGSKTASFGIELTGNLALTTADFTSGSVQIPLNLVASAGNATLTGGPLDDTLDDGGHVATMLGGPGNDTYLVHNVGTVVTEMGSTDGTNQLGATQASGKTADPVLPLPPDNAGNDTVVSSVSYTLPAGVENLTLSGAGNINGNGNSLDNVITSNAFGNNVLTGAGGTDTFVFGPSSGKDSIADFHLGDTIQFDHTVFASVSAILAALGTDAQGNATITANANEAVTVDNVSATLLQQHSDAFHIK
jgi:Ca2+-binding RTX toxin-like protein